MNRDDIIRMAREAGWAGPEENAYYVSMLERFFHMAQAAEREACAKICVVQAKEADGSVDYSDACHDIAAAIRARGYA